MSSVGFERGSNFEPRIGDLFGAFDCSKLDTQCSFEGDCFKTAEEDSEVNAKV